MNVSNTPMVQSPPLATSGSTGVDVIKKAIDLPAQLLAGLEMPSTPPAGTGTQLNIYA